LPINAIKVAESGIRTPEDVLELRASGYNGFLIGESFMRHAQPADACARFINALKAANSLQTTA
jgi:indole-3-glycerol phosphate synthase